MKKVLSRGARPVETPAPLHRRLMRLGQAGAAGREPAYRPGFLGTLGVSAWCGLATGAVEIGILLVRGQWEGPAKSGVLHLNRQYLWMVPTGNLSIFWRWV